MSTLGSGAGDPNIRNTICVELKFCAERIRGADYHVPNIYHIVPNMDAEIWQPNIIPQKRIQTQTFIKDRRTTKIYEMVYNNTMRSLELNGLRVYTKEWV